MNKTAIKNFAIAAREKLMDDITYKAELIGVRADGIRQPLPQSTKDLQFFDIGLKDYTQLEGQTAIEQRNALVKALEQRAAGSDYATAYTAIMEEIAYTWFNRLIAIRFMEVNDYLPGRVRVLSSELAGKTEPDLVSDPFNSDLDFTAEETAQILQWKDDNRLEDLFRMLFIRQCNSLHGILPALFEHKNDYTELLLPIAFADKDGVVYRLVHEIPEDDFNVEKEGQVEIIGWLYQYYNTVPKDETFALLKKNVKITKERIPAATQLFTPDWIVRYMVENSLGRLWVEGHPNDSLKESWQYYLPEAQQEPTVQAQLETTRAQYGNLHPEDIKVIDPCMGSGHILVYCFDVLMQIYQAQGYTQRDAVQSILEHNLYGLDIDNRAAQLAYFAVMMKARQYDRRIFSRNSKPHVYAIAESNGVNRAHLPYLGAGLSPLEKNSAINEINGLLDTFTDAKEYGAILHVEAYNWELLKQFAAGLDQSRQMTLETIGIEQTQAQLQLLIEVGQIMAQQYHVVVTNPPYMGSSGMDAKLSKYVKDKYPDSKSDLFACFIERCGQMTAKNCYQAMITQHAWMFLSSYEKLRAKLLMTDTINMAHLGARAFEEIGGEVVQTTSFVMRRSHLDAYKGTYCRLIEPTTQQGKEEMFLAAENRYTAQQSNFSKIPGSPIAYWVSKKIAETFILGKRIDEIGQSRSGMQTGDNNLFLRFWHEVCINNIKFETKPVDDLENIPEKWFPQPKGGPYRKWYGNLEYVVNFQGNGKDLRAFSGTSIIKNPHLFFKEGMNWSHTTSRSFSARYMPIGCIFNVEAPSFYPNDSVSLYYILAFSNTKILDILFGSISQTMHYMAGDMAKIPVIVSEEKKPIIEKIVKENISLSRIDWDSFETSWDFIRHPLVPSAYEKQEQMNSQFASSRMEKFGRISWHYNNWERECNDRFNQLKANEEELNRIFIDIYGLQDELTPEVADKDVTVRKADLQRDIKSLISYAVGCMFGRYSLDVDGLAYAGGQCDAGKYSTFLPDADNCIPITDEEYFEDDMVGLFCAWLKKAYGADTLEENLDFIANALGNKGQTSRDVIRNYFLNDFIKDHIKMYQKRPIYWLFDSGKQNGFKALVYMHRWNADTVGNLRVEYLHRIQRVYEKEMDRMQELIDTSKDNKEISAATKRKEKLQKQLKETREYDEKIGHIALSRIDIDLDDGVKVNYEKVQTGKDGKKMQILAKM